MRPIRRWFTGVVLALLVATTLSAQERRGGRAGGQRGRGRGQAVQQEPKFWASIGTGFLLLARVQDGNSQAVWDFGEGFPLTFSLERAFSSGLSVGFAGSYIRAPMVYSGTTANGGCADCDAHATVASYGAVFHGGGPTAQTGLYRSFRLFLGAIQYGAFEQDSPKRSLPPSKANIDFLFSGGAGIGYAFAPDWRMELRGDYMNSLHERDNLPGNAQVLARHYLIGVELRVGI